MAESFGVGAHIKSQRQQIGEKERNKWDAFEGEGTPAGILKRVAARSLLFMQTHTHTNTHTHTYNHCHQ